MASPAPHTLSDWWARKHPASIARCQLDCHTSRPSIADDPTRGQALYNYFEATKSVFGLRYFSLCASFVILLIPISSFLRCVELDQRVHSFSNQVLSFTTSVLPNMKSFFLALGCAVAVEAHVGVFTDGMFCRGGNDGGDNQNTNLVVNPLYNLTTDQWWMQRDRGCDKVPPPEGEFLDLPAGGSFTVELAINRAFTTLSYGGDFTSDWPDGLDHPEDWAAPAGGECLMDNPDGEGGPLHTKSEEASAGTAWAISYEEDLSAVTMENLVVFSVLEHTPWKRLATYDVPADLPACPEKGCYCAWLWIPDGCKSTYHLMNNLHHTTANKITRRRAQHVHAELPMPRHQHFFDQDTRRGSGPSSLP